MAATLAPPATGLRLAIDRAALVAALKSARVAAKSGRTSLPILEYVLLEADATAGTLTLSATDLEVGLTTTVTGDVTVGGSVAVPAALALSLLSQCPVGPLTLRSDAGRLRITGPGVRLALPTLDAEDFPVLPGNGPEHVATAWGETTVADFSAALDRVRYCAAAAGAGRYEYTGVFLRPIEGGVSLECTDTFSVAGTTLALAAMPDAARPLILPARPLAEILGVLPDGPLVLTLARNALRLETPTTTGYARTLDGSFPDFARLMPRNEDYAHVIPFDVAGLTAAVKLVRAAEADGKLRLNFGPDGLTLAARDGDLATVDLPLEVPMPPLRVTLDPARVLAALGTIDGEIVTLGINDGTKVVARRPRDGAPATHGIMPLA